MLALTGVVLAIAAAGGETPPSQAPSQEVPAAEAQAQAVAAPEAPPLDPTEERLRNLEDDVEGLLGAQDRLLERVDRMRLNWNGSYRVTCNNVHVGDRSVDSGITAMNLVLDNKQPKLDANGQPVVAPVVESSRRDVDAWYEASWVNRLRLTMSYEASDRLRFYGTLVVFKYFNELKDHPVALDMHASRYPRDTTLRLERAYFDWFITDWLVLSAGRVAAAEGPPAELKENTQRSATWGVHMVEAEMESVMATLHLSRLLEGTTLRFFYIPFLTHDDFDISDDLLLLSDRGIAPMHVLGLMLELHVPALGQNLWQLGAVVVPQFSPRDVALRLPGVADPVRPSTPTADSLGQYGLASALVELENVGGWGLDLFAAYTLTVLRPSDGRMVYNVPYDLPVFNPDSGERVSTYSGQQRVEVGLASYEEGADSTNLGHFAFAGLRYTLPVFDELAPRLGLELNWGSRYHVAWSTPSDLLINKLATKGFAGEIYYIQRLVPEHLYLRIGALHQIRQYQGLYIGPTREVDQQITNLYGLLDARW